MDAKRLDTKKFRAPSAVDTIDRLATAVFDNGRRGEPLPGCDCIRCFGYCIYDGDAASREASLRGDGGKAARENNGAPLKFEA